MVMARYESAGSDLYVMGSCSHSFHLDQTTLAKMACGFFPGNQPYFLSVRNGL